MLSKEKFIELINFIKSQNEAQDNLCSALEKCSPGCYVDAFIYSEYENKCVDLIKLCLNIPENNDLLEYWMYDLEYGTKYKDGCCEYDISTVEKLYDNLVEIGEDNGKDN